MNHTDSRISDATMKRDNSYKFEAEHPESGETREYDKLNDVLGADIDTDEWNLSKVTV